MLFYYRIYVYVRVMCFLLIILNTSPYKDITLAVLVMHTKEDLNNFRGNNIQFNRNRDTQSLSAIFSSHLGTHNFLGNSVSQQGSTKIIL
jgi:hypothetical protein